MRLEDTGLFSSTKGFLSEMNHPRDQGQTAQGKDSSVDGIRHIDEALTQKGFPGASSCSAGNPIYVDRRGARHHPLFRVNDITSSPSCHCYSNTCWAVQGWPHVNVKTTNGPLLFLFCRLCGVPFCSRPVSLLPKQYCQQNKCRVLLWALNAFSSPL